MNATAFSELLIAYGFMPFAHDFASTALGFHHEIFNVLIHDNPVFTTDSTIHEQLDTPDAMLHCDLMTDADDFSTVIPYFYKRWFKELRYCNPVLQIINLDQRANSTTFNILTMSQHNAMTFVFNVSALKSAHLPSVDLRHFF
ncbi:hypothetical protein [Marinobacter sp. S6332]|uniref:hypothetical protein n=1 Tax=Marinobacter sp. S6332 TaxID=2926403 RepID=UPI001FF40CA4|nr:hypothetical protein [Marinobacter sp. S6332]MCK0165791.1 hypothetical protein [Marinobacter sp. S6332]